MPLNSSVVHSSHHVRVLGSIEINSKKRSTVRAFDCSALLPELPNCRTIELTNLLPVAGDPAARHLATFPHHKHTATGIEATEEPTLAFLLREIADLLSFV